MRKGWIVVIVLFIILIAGAIALFVIPSKTSEDTSPTSTNPQSTGNPSVDALKDTIVVDAPAQNAQVTSPLAITGKARGNWYAEATAPIALLDQNGSVIAQGTIRAQGDWMTTDFVPFVGTLTYPDQPAGSVGTLVLTNDNPSGDPSRQKTLDIPVKF